LSSSFHLRLEGEIRLIDWKKRSPEGGWLGIGDKLTPVNWGAIQVEKKGDSEFSFMTTLAKTQLTQEKSFDNSSWSDNTANSWLQQLPDTRGKKLVRMSSVDDSKLFEGQRDWWNQGCRDGREVRQDRLRGRLL
jgi:hypothetical protein